MLTRRQTILGFAGLTTGYPAIGSRPAHAAPQKLRIGYILPAQSQLGAGAKMRVPQSDVLLRGFQALGVEVASLPFPQLYEALRAGTFDGQENPIATIRAAKFDQVQKFLTMSGHAYDPAVFVMSSDVFNDLSAEDRSSFIQAARVGAKASRDFAADAEKAGVQALQQNGMTVQASIDRARFAAAMGSAGPDFEKRFGHELIESIRQPS
jgi:TRAP-type C4-dicarboxylate transport system substrate-binding protein